MARTMYLIAKDSDGRAFLIEAQVQKAPIPMLPQDTVKPDDPPLMISSVLEVSYCSQGKRIVWRDDSGPMGIKWQVTRE